MVYTCQHAWRQSSYIGSENGHVLLDCTEVLSISENGQVLLDCTQAIGFQEYLASNIIMLKTSEHAENCEQMWEM